MTPIYNYAVAVRDHTWARVYLNDVPLYDAPHFGPDSATGPVNQLLRAGENEVAFEVLRSPQQPKGGYMPGAVAFQLYVVANLGAPEGTLLDKRMVCDLRFPEVFEVVSPEHRRVPFFHRHVFRVEDDLPSPAFFAAPSSSFDCRGLPAQREAVARLFGALERGDHDGLLDDLSLKFEAMERAFPEEDRMRVGSRMREWREELLAYEPRLDRPLDLEALHFAARRGGQVVHVTRLDGKRALEATCARDPDRQIQTDLVMIEHAGRWRVFL